MRTLQVKNDKPLIILRSLPNFEDLDKNSKLKKFIIGKLEFVLSSKKEKHFRHR